MGESDNIEQIKSDTKCTQYDSIHIALKDKQNHIVRYMNVETIKKSKEIIPILSSHLQGRGLC